MEERKTIFDYAGQALTTFGITVILLLGLGFFFGDAVREQEASTLFQLGSQGLAAETLLQFLLVSVAVTAIRFLFFTDTLIKRMPMVGRMGGMLLSVITVIAVMSLCFDWFPAGSWESWALFLLCFAICFAASLSLMILKERLENQKMAEALEKLKEKEQGLK